MRRIANLDGKVRPDAVDILRQRSDILSALIGDASDAVVIDDDVRRRPRTIGAAMASPEPLESALRASMIMVSMMVPSVMRPERASRSRRSRSISSAVGLRRVKT